MNGTDLLDIISQMSIKLETGYVKKSNNVAPEQVVTGKLYLTMKDLISQALFMCKTAECRKYNIDHNLFRKSKVMSIMNLFQSTFFKDKRQDATISPFLKANLVVELKADKNEWFQKALTICDGIKEAETIINKIKLKKREQGKKSLVKVKRLELILNEIKSIDDNLEKRLEDSRVADKIESKKGSLKDSMDAFLFFFMIGLMLSVGSEMQSLSFFN